MKSTNRTARLAGFLYLLVIGFGVYALMVVRPSLVVPGDAAATAGNIAASESLFRIGVVSELIMYVCFLLLPLPLYALLKRVNRNLAALMVIFVVVSVPMGMLNTLNNFAALSYVSGPEYLSVFSADQLQTQMMFYLDLYENGYLIAQIFFGAWLLPLGYLIYKSGLMPRIMGVLLVLGGLSQLTTTFTGFLFPGYESILLTAFELFGFSEILFCAWLLIMGVKETAPEILNLEQASI